MLSRQWLVLPAGAERSHYWIRGEGMEHCWFWTLSSFDKVSFKQTKGVMLRLGLPHKAVTHWDLVLKGADVH